MIMYKLPFTIGFATILYTLSCVALGLNTLSYTNTLPYMLANKITEWSFNNSCQYKLRKCILC